MRLYDNEKAKDILHITIIVQFSRLNHIEIFSLKGILGNPDGLVENFYQNQSITFFYNAKYFLI